MDVMRFGELILTPTQQMLCIDHIDDVSRSTRNSVCATNLFAKVSTGDSVCIGVPSRGISCLNQVVLTVVDDLIKIGAHPFIVPAMGSHGGGTAEGQRQVLTALETDLQKYDVSIQSDIHAEQVGGIQLNGKTVPIYWDRFAAHADHVLVINRIKSHTAFSGPVESGLTKILTLGLGKPAGAKAIHQAGVKETIQPAAQWLTNHFPILGGIAIIENGVHAPMLIEAVRGEDIAKREPELLDLARSTLPNLPYDELDVLIVGAMGKDISGTGMDTNVIGKYRRNWGEPFPNFKRIVVLDLTDASHGNATGVGFADIITQQLFDKIDMDATRLNCLTAGNFNGAKIPIIAKDADQAIEWALQGFGENPRVVYINSTLDVETVWVSEALL